MYDVRFAVLCLIMSAAAFLDLQFKYYMSNHYLNLFNYKYRLKFQLSMNDVYFLCLRQHVT